MVLGVIALAIGILDLVAPERDEDEDHRRMG